MSTADLAAPLRAHLPSTPSLRDENASTLCSRRPPYGLVSEGVLRKEERSLRAGWNTSLWGRPPPVGNSTAALCELFFERLAHATVDAPRRFGTCAVVGSGGTLSGSGSGEAIDAHDAVIRFNGAPIESFAADVGRRTTVWVVAGMHLIQPARVKPPQLVALYCSNAWLGSCHFGLLAARRKVGSVMLINPQLASDTAALPLGDGPAARVSANGRTRPSAGLMGVALAAKLCDSVRLYGFGNDSHPNSSGACRHYYDCKFSQRRYFSGVTAWSKGPPWWHHSWPPEAHESAFEGLRLL